ncbi:DNA-binding transcriptional MerR regulator [Anaerotaenia torta]|uniref:MerR family transcriptional regulator n=1 Tax=Anaerotaenia torta TaxID=433293 RepID=UPI003D25CF90
MTELIKAGDLSNRYGVTTRTLRYYEEIGLIQSRRTKDYAYRMYDDANIKRLEQILILRKLNIGIKDIRRIFSTAGSEAVLEVLGQKVNDIDEEVALLHELKAIVLTFIRQIEQADFSKASDIKQLYDRAKEIETQFINAEYTGNPSPVHRLFEVTEKLEERAVSRLSIPDNVLRRMLQNVYFIWGSNEGISVAEELGRRYGLFVYHTCENRAKHSQNADPKFQPGLCRSIPDFWAQDPEDAMQWEHEVVRDFTPMVIMDLIQLTAKYDKVICENDIDIESILPYVTNAVRISNDRAADEFCNRYAEEIRSRDISEKDKERLVGTVNAAFEKVKGEIPGETTQYGVKHIIWDDNSTVEQAVDMIAEYFGLYCG